jgi:hypothetical protein
MSDFLDLPYLSIAKGGKATVIILGSGLFIVNQSDLPKGRDLLVPWLNESLSPYIPCFVLFLSYYQLLINTSLSSETYADFRTIPT